MSKERTYEFEYEKIAENEGEEEVVESRTFVLRNFTTPERKQLMKWLRIYDINSKLLESEDATAEQQEKAMSTIDQIENNIVVASIHGYYDDTNSLIEFHDDDEDSMEDLIEFVSYDMSLDEYMSIFEKVLEVELKDFTQNLNREQRRELEKMS